GFLARETQRLVLVGCPEVEDPAVRLVLDTPEDPRTRRVGQKKGSSQVIRERPMRATVLLGHRMAVEPDVLVTSRRRGIRGERGLGQEAQLRRVEEVPL